MPAKHDWDVGDRPHLFSVQESVLICFITKRLAEQIVSMSDEAKIYNEEKTYAYYH